MRTTSYISTAALAAALLASPQLAQGAGLKVDLGAIGVDADVDLGGDDLVDADVDVDLGSNDDSDGSGIDLDLGSDDDDDGGRLVDVDLGGDDDDDDGRLVDLDIGGGTPRVGPNGGTLIDLDVGALDGDTLLDGNVQLGGGTQPAPLGNGLISGNVRIGSLGDPADRTEALLGLIEDPALGDVDLDAAIDDRRVSITALADLVDEGDLARIEAAIDLGGACRDDLLDALGDSTELAAILGNEGIDLYDVLAVEVAENGAARVIVLDDTVELALLGDGGDLADVGIADDATIDLDLLSDAELAELDLDLLPPQLQTAVGLRLLGNDTLAGLSVDDLVDLDIALGTGTGGTGGGVDDGDGGDDAGGDGGDGGDDGDDDSDDGAGSGGGNSGNGGNGGGNGGNGANGNGSGNGASGGSGAQPPVAGAPSLVASLSCNIGTLAMARGMAATPQAIATAASLELVRIDGCERVLVDAQVDAVHAAIESNPALSEALDGASIPLDAVIGATIQGGTLTLFINPVVG